MESTSATGRVRGKNPSPVELPPIALTADSTDLKNFVVPPLGKRDQSETAPDPVAEQQNKDLSRGEVLLNQLLPVVNNTDLMARADSINNYTRLGVVISCSLEELQLAYDVLSKALHFPDDIDLLAGPDATQDQRIAYNKLQKLRTKFKEAYDVVGKNVKEENQNRAKAQEIIEKFKAIITGEKKRISEVLRVNSSSTVREITVAYTWYVREMTDIAGTRPFTGVADKNYKGSKLSENETKDLALYLEITRIHQHFDKLYKRLIEEKAIKNGVSFTNRDSYINSTEFGPETPKKETPKQKPTEQQADRSAEFTRYKDAFARDMQRIVENPNSATWDSIISPLRKLVKLDPTYFKIYAADFAQLESIQLNLTYSSSKWTDEFVESQLARIKLDIVRDAARVVIGKEIKRTERNEVNAKEKFGKDIQSRSKLGIDNLIAFLDEHSRSTVADGLHTKDTTQTATRLASLLRNAKTEMQSLHFLELHSKYNPHNIHQIFANELRDLDREFDAMIIRNSCIDAVDTFAKPLMDEKAKKYVQETLNSGGQYQSIIDVFQIHMSKNEVIRTTWSALKRAKSEFDSPRTKDRFLKMSQAEILAGKRAPYDDAMINWEQINDTLTRLVAKKTFWIWADAKQKEWQKDSDHDREDLSTLLHRFVIDAIPFYVDSGIQRNMAIQDTLPEEKRRRLRESILKRLEGIVESELNSVDSSIREMSIAAVSESLAFVKQENRFNPGSVQNIIVNNLKFEFHEGEKQGETGYGASRSKNKLSPSLFLALSHMSRSLYSELETIKKAANFAVDLHGRIAQHPTLFIDATPRGDLQRPNEKVDVYRNRRKRHFTENMIALLYARLIAEQNPPVQNEKVRNRNSVAKRFNLPEKMYFSDLDTTDLSMLYEVKKEAVAYLVQIGFEPSDIEKVDKGLTLSPDRASLIKTANDFLLNSEQQVELLDPDLVVTRRPSSENLALGLHTKGYLGDFEVDPYLGREYEWNRPTRLDENRLSAATRLERIKTFLKSGSIDFNLTGTYGSRDIPSGLKKRTSNASLPLFPFTLSLPIGEFLNDKDIQKLEASAQDTYTNRRELLKRIQELLADSDKMRNFVLEYNTFVGTLMDEAVEDPNAFLQKIGVGSNPNVALAPEAWLTIFFDISYGRFASLERIQKSSNIKAARQYGLRLRNNRNG